MKVSVIVVVHNRHKECDELLYSLLRQTVLPSEIIIIDDQSNPPYRPSVVEKTSIPIKIIRTHREMGLGMSRSIGAYMAKEEIIAFIDDDAIASANWIEKIISTFKKTRAAVVGGICKPYYMVKKMPKWWKPELFGKYLAIENEFITGCNFAVRSSVFKQIGFFNPRLGRVGGMLISNEEREFLMRVSMAGKKIVFNSNIVVFHRVTNSKLNLKYIIKRIIFQGISIYLTSGLNIPQAFRNVNEVKIEDSVRKEKKHTKKKKIITFIEKIFILMFQYTLTLIGFLIGMLIGYRKLKNTKISKNFNFPQL